MAGSRGTSSAPGLALEAALDRGQGEAHAAVVVLETAELIMVSLEPEPDRDQLTQAVTVGLCVALAGVLIVLAIV